MRGFAAIASMFDGRRGNWRAIVDRLLEEGKIAPRDYLKALAEGPGPAGWAFALFVFFGAAQLVAGIIMFFAYNWRELSDMAKIALPQAAMALAFAIFALAPRRSALSVVAAVAATAMIGVSMGVVGQVYQLGADPWTLFAIWAGFALPLALVARSDALFAVFFLIATTAYFLYAEDHIRPRFEMAQAVPAIYAGLALLAQVLRDIVLEPMAGPQPRWQRWLCVFAALLAVAGGGIGEAMADKLFEKGAIGSMALFAVATAVFLIYRVRDDRPSRALALFAVALWVGAFGLRAIWRVGFDGAGEVAFGFILSAGWVVLVTAGLAVLLRGRGGAR
jgi:uncharacterized membrane protein